MKHRTAAHPQRQPQRLTRAQRRAAERAQPHQRKRQQRRLSTNAFVGGVITAVAVIAIAFYVYVQTSSNSSLKGVADPSALNPVTAPLSTGSQAPDFTLNDSSGRTHHLAAQRGHPILLEFFAVWCPVCHAEAPILAKITRAYVPRGVRVWSVLANPYGPSYETSGRSDLTLAQAADLKWFAQTYNVHHPQLIDPNFTTVNRYGVGTYPGLYVLDKSGVIRLVHDGGLNYGVLSHALDRALK
jgi:peroxiredoxin